MARSTNQKLKILYVMNYLLRNTDADHSVGTKELISYLASQGISAERKSIYDDIDGLRSWGLDIEKTSDGRGWYVASRDFELAELKLLVDSVQSSKFITRKKSETLIGKIETLASSHEARLLQRQVYVANRIKTMNESIYYNVDEIHAGISQGQKISFRYFEYTLEKTRRYRRNGQRYVVSPYALTWDDENYYLVAYDSDVKIIKHFRVDKMTDIQVTDEDRDGAEVFSAMDMGAYSRKVFDMFSGQETRVKLRFDNRLAGAVIDRLGQEVMLIPDGEDRFTVTADIVVSPRFFGWIFGFGSLAEILAPDSVRRQMADQLSTMVKVYEVRP